MAGATGITSSTTTAERLAIPVPRLPPTTRTIVSAPVPDVAALVEADLADEPPRVARAAKLLEHRRPRALGARDGVEQRVRGLIVILWRAGLRVQEALDLTEADLDQRRGSLLVRRGKGGRRREVGMDDWGWQELQPWLEVRVELPIGPLFCVINGATRRPAVGNRGRSRSTPSHHGRGRRTPTLRAAPTSPRPRRRDGARRRAADRHPTPARPQQPRHHLRLPPGHRQRGDHRHCPRATRTNDPRQPIAATLRRPLLAQCGRHARGLLASDRLRPLHGGSTTRKGDSMAKAAAAAAARIARSRTSSARSV